MKLGGAAHLTLSSYHYTSMHKGAYEFFNKKETLFSSVFIRPAYFARGLQERLIIFLIVWPFWYTLQSLLLEGIEKAA